jgi:hypothetical protein
LQKKAEPWEGVKVKCLQRLVHRTEPSRVSEAPEEDRHCVSRLCVFNSKT